MKPEYKDVDYMGGSVRAVTGPDGAVQHITEPGGYFEFLKDAWEDYRKALEDFFATPVNDEKIIAAGRRWERFGRILIGYAGTMFDLYRDDAEKRRLILDLYDRFSKDMAVVQRNISKYRALLNAAEDPDPTVKTKMAWGFLAMVNTGRWLEYRADELGPEESDFRPGKDAYEILSDPGLLQRMFFRELQACRLEPMANAQTVRWGVPEGTRDPASVRIIHDDLVMSAALAALADEYLPLYGPDFDKDRYGQSLIDASRAYKKEMWDLFRIRI